MKEILIQMYYGFSTDPNAYGETALFEKKDGSYQPLMPPGELGSDLYKPGITVVCRNYGRNFRSGRPCRSTLIRKSVRLIFICQ